MVDISKRSSNQFPRQERLSSKKEINLLFRFGASTYLFPFKVISMILPTEIAPKTCILVSVSKKHFKRATDRNHIKRQVREGWRLQKMPLEKLLTEQNKQMNIALIYTAKNILESGMIHDKINKIIQRFVEQYADPH